MVVPNGSERNTARAVLDSLRISQVYEALTGIAPRRTGRDTWRAPAVDGDNQDRISGDDSRGIWHDFRDETGGGILDLVVRVRGGSRVDALRWCAELAGIQIDDKPLSPEERERWAAERKELQRQLPEARHWRRAAIDMAEESLDVMKAAFFDGPSDRIDFDGIRDMTNLLARLQRIDGTALVAEYNSWVDSHPGLTAGMVRSAKAREQAERRALTAYLRMTERRCAA